MSSSSDIFVSQEEFNLFHSIDRMLYTLLVTDLCRDPLECIQIMALWIWLERAGFNNVVKIILSLPHTLINELVDEALTCLNCINNTPSFFSSSEPITEIPLTQNLMKKDISLQFFQENQDLVLRGIAKVETQVCIRAFTDIMKHAVERNAVRKLAESSVIISPAFQHGFGPLGMRGGETSKAGMAIGRRSTSEEMNVVQADERTMLVTFSKGYPVTESEVMEFFTRIFGNCIESFRMQDVRAPDEHALYARIVFYWPSVIDAILNGVTKAKFTINGKYVWMRKFVPKRPCTSLPQNLSDSV